MPKKKANRVNIEVEPLGLQITPAQKAKLNKAFKLDVVDTFNTKDLDVVIEYQTPVTRVPKPPYK
jgi:hypothetical protein